MSDCCKSTTTMTGSSEATAEETRATGCCQDAARD